jgi:hypothetical protein
MSLPVAPKHEQDNKTTGPRDQRKAEPALPPELSAEKRTLQHYAFEAHLHLFHSTLNHQLSTIVGN